MAVANVAVIHGVRDACSFKLCVWRTTIMCELYRLMGHCCACMCVPYYPVTGVVLGFFAHQCNLLMPHVAMFCVAQQQSCYMASSGSVRGIVCVAHSWQQVLSAALQL